MGRSSKSERDCNARRRHGARWPSPCTEHVRDRANHGDGHRGVRSAAGELELPHLDVARATKALHLEVYSELQEGFCTISQCVKTDVVVGFTFLMFKAYFPCGPYVETRTHDCTVPSDGLGPIREIPMKIAIATKDWLSISGHAGQARCWLVYDIGQTPPAGSLPQPQCVELAKHQVMHHCEDDGPHLLDGVDIVVAGSAGDRLRAPHEKARRGSAANRRNRSRGGANPDSRRRSPARSAFQHEPQHYASSEICSPGIDGLVEQPDFAEYDAERGAQVCLNCPRPQYRWPANAGRRARGTCNGKRSRRL